MATKWDIVKEKIDNAQGVAWDTCHKIYILMDSEQVEKTKGYGYEALITKNQASGKIMLALVKEWYKDSCALRFIESVSTNEKQETDFDVLIGQG